METESKHPQVPPPAGPVPTTAAAAPTVRLAWQRALRLGLVVALVALLHALLAHVLEGTLDLANHRPPSRAAREGAGVLLRLALVAAALVVVQRRVVFRRPARAGRLLLAALAIYLPLGYVAFLSSPPRGIPLQRPWDRGVWVHRPGSRVDQRIGTGPISHESVNAHGFRMPEWNEKKPAGVVRGVLIGDSFAFGTGVNDGETLSVQLERELSARNPGVRYEVVNLGIPGSNLGSYIPVYDAAVRRLAPDFVVLCLMLPTDLSPWDLQAERDALTRPSAFSLASFLLGGAPAHLLWFTSKMELRMTPRTEAFFREQRARLAALRTGPTPPPLLVFSFHFPLDAIHEPTGAPFADFARTTTLWSPSDDPAWHIPGDGHSSAEGNRHYAALLADHFMTTPALRDLRP